MTTTQQQHTPHPALLTALQRAQERKRELETYIKWEDELFSNPNLSATHKLAIRATRRAVQRGQTKDEQGRTRINLTTIAEQIGVSPDTVSRGLKILEQAGVIPEKVTRPEIQENGERWTRHYITLNEELLAKPKEIQPPAPRNHGGNRYHCQKCGSDKVKIKTARTIVCKCCSHETELDTTERDQEPETSNDQAQVKNFDELGGNLQGIIKPVSPLSGAGCDDYPRDPGTAHTDQEDRDDIAAAALLLALAGQVDEHIEMSRTGQSKYYTVHRPLSLKNTLEHLQGGQARGAVCSRPDGQTRGLCWDADDAECWELLRLAARHLAAAGYVVLLEESPADRGGHLWIIYSDLVDAAAARHHAHFIAPELADLGEYWPPAPKQAATWNKVRLPGGRYVRRGQYVETPVNAWCRLISVADGEISERGQAEAARFLLSHQTQVGIVPAATPAESLQDDQAQAHDVAQQERGDPALPLLAPPTLELPTSDDHQVEQESKMHPSAAVDGEWYRKYNTPEGRRLWFSFTPAYVAAWYNHQHTLEEIRPRERNGMAFSPNVQERTPSTGYRMTAEGERYTDFSASARRSDGTHDTGDALELQVKVSQAPKPEVIRQAAQELLRQARQELESAATTGQLVPAWLEEIITDAGREHYARVASQAGHIDQAAQIRAQALASPATSEPEPQHGGLTGFLDAQVCTQESNLLHGNNHRQLRESALAVPTETNHTHDISKRLAADSVTVGMQELEMIRDYGRAHEWTALVVNGEEIIPAGRADWLDFVWLSHKHEQQRRVYELLRRGNIL